MKIEISELELLVAVDAIKTFLDTTYQGRPRARGAKLDREVAERVYERLSKLKEKLNIQGTVGENRAEEMKRYKRDSRRHGEM